MDHGPAGGARELPLFGPRGRAAPGENTLSHKSEVLNRETRQVGPKRVTTPQRSQRGHPARHAALKARRVVAALPLTLGT